MNFWVNPIGSWDSKLSHNQFPIYKNCSSTSLSDLQTLASMADLKAQSNTFRSQGHLSSWLNIWMNNFLYFPSFSFLGLRGFSSNITLMAPKIVCTHIFTYFILFFYFFALASITGPIPYLKAFFHTSSFSRKLTHNCHEIPINFSINTKVFRR